jgi:hypothetical protein
MISISQACGVKSIAFGVISISLELTPKAMEIEIIGLKRVKCRNKKA